LLVKRWLGVRVPPSAQTPFQAREPNPRSDMVARRQRATIRVSLALTDDGRLPLSVAHAWSRPQTYSASSSLVGALLSEPLWRPPVPCSGAGSSVSSILRCAASCVPSRHLA